MKHGDAVIGGSRIPFVVEVWAGKKEKSNDVDVVWFCVNRTPITGEVEAYRDGDKDICLHGSGLGHYCSSAPKKGGFNIVVHVTTPYCPIMSDGKVPDLGPFVKPIMDAVGAATRKAQRAAPKDSKVTQKSVILDNLDDVVADVSGPAQHRFSVRQILYKMRPLVKEATGEDLQLGNFTAIVTDYEAEHGEIPRMYREPRGSIYHPHRKETIPLSTLTVERYERPPWCYNKLVYNEKEGFNEALKENGWFERNDCAPCSSKGFTTRAIVPLLVGGSISWAFRRVDRDFVFVMSAYAIDPGASLPRVSEMTDFNIWAWNSRVFQASTHCLYVSATVCECAWPISR
jgi:hypothetical protein